MGYHGDDKNRRELRNELLAGWSPPANTAPPVRPRRNPSGNNKDDSDQDKTNTTTARLNRVPADHNASVKPFTSQDVMLWSTTDEIQRSLSSNSKSGETILPTIQ